MVSIIVLSYNTKDLLSACLRSVFSCLKVPFEVIVVDNASEDGSVEMVNKQFKKAKMVVNRTNLGFSKGNNIGVKHVKGDYLLFLNSDTKLLTHNVSDMVELCEQEGKIAVVGGKFTTPRGLIEKSFGQTYNLLALLQYLLGERTSLLAHEAPKRVQDVDWVSGGFMLVRKDVFERMGGFDERFFMYVEDMEFCYRVKRLGYRVVYYPNAIILHEGQGSSSRSHAIEYIYKGLSYFYRKHKTALEYTIAKILLSAKAYVAIAVGMASGNRDLVLTYRRALGVLA